MFTYRRQQNCPVLILFNTPLTFIPILHKTAYSPIYAPINAIYFIKIPVIYLFFAFFVCNISNMFTYFACNFLILYIAIITYKCYNISNLNNKGVLIMLTYFKRHFAQLNKHNLPRQHATKVIAVLLQYIKALHFRVLRLKTYKGKNGNITFNIYVQHYQYSHNTYCLSWHTNAKNCIVYTGSCIV
jgi:hypothetical protein